MPERLLINYKKKLIKTSTSTPTAMMILETPSDNSEYTISKFSTSRKKGLRKNGDVLTRFSSNTLRNKSQKTKAMKRKSLPMKSVMKKSLN